MNKLTLACALLCTFKIAGASDPQYQTGQGSLQLDSANIKLRDTKRNKDLPVFAYFPKEAGSYPVIVFSHGALGSGKSYANLLSFWAGRGYVCLAPTHDDSLTLHPEQIRKQGGREVAREEFTQLFHDPPGWKNRAADISLVIDSLDQVQKLAPALKGKLDAVHIGVGGHSYGAYTTHLVSGALVDLPEEKAHSFKDDRAKAFLVLSGAGPSQMGLTEHSWDHCDKPMMFETGSRDPGAKGQGPMWRLHAYDSCPAGDKYSIYIENASHFTFVGRQESKEFDVVKASSIAFWDAYLKDDPAARGYLKSDAILHLNENGVTYKSK
jgi:predicted dienelactone hydrolase